MLMPVLAAAAALFFFTTAGEASAFCRSTTCRTSANHECPADDNGCPPGKLCDRSQKQCVDPCATAICPSGQSCIDGACVDLCKVVQCPMNQVCSGGGCSLGRAALSSTGADLAGFFLIGFDRSSGLSAANSNASTAPTEIPAGTGTPT